MRGELHFLAPAAVAEHHDGEVILAREAELDVGTDPFGRPFLDTPAHLVAPGQLDHLHVEAAQQFFRFQVEAERDDAADLRGAAGLLCPPAGKALDGRQRGVDVGGRRLDADAMNDIRHVELRSIC